jgi:hypothetical protein
MIKMPDPATPEESTLIAISIKDALAAIDSARSILAAFIEREG